MNILRFGFYFYYYFLTYIIIKINVTTFDYEMFVRNPNLLFFQFMEKYFPNNNAGQKKLTLPIDVIRNNSMGVDCSIIHKSQPKLLLKEHIAFLQKFFPFSIHDCSKSGHMLILQKYEIGNNSYLEVSNVTSIKEKKNNAFLDLRVIPLDSKSYLSRANNGFVGNTTLYSFNFWETLSPYLLELPKNALGAWTYGNPRIIKNG